MSRAPSMPDESEVSVPEVLAAGSTFARYEIVRCIGMGGMGAVFEATHTLLKKRVALKTMHSSLGRSEASRARFLREAETVARIRHPNVVDITDVGIEQGVPYLVMEFLEGEDLAHALFREGPLSPQRAAEAVLPVAAGLAAVHRLGIVHRDVKPENVLLSRDPHGAIVPKLVDFGVSKDVEASLRAGSPPLHTVTGTPHYMSPEQARGSASLDGRTDQYALGIMLYQCLTGVRPYESQSLLELIHLIDCGQYRPVRELVPEVPEALEAIVHRAMSRHPRDRFASTEAFGRALLAFASERTRLMYEREFAVDHIFDATLLVMGAAPEHYSAETQPGGAAFATGPDRTPPRTTSGIRVREELSGLAETDRKDVAAPPLSARRRAGALWIGALVGLAICGCAFYLSTAHPPAVSTNAPAKSPARAGALANTSYTLEISAEPAQASIELDDVWLGQGHATRTLLRDGRDHRLRVSAPGFETQSLSFRDAPPALSHITLRALPAQVPVAEPSPRLTPAPEKPHARRATARPVTQPSTKVEPAPTPALDIQLSR